MPEFYVYHIERRLVAGKQPKPDAPGVPPSTVVNFHNLRNAWGASVTLESADSVSALAAAKRAFPFLGSSIAVAAVDPEVTKREIEGEDYVAPL